MILNIIATVFLILLPILIIFPKILIFLKRPTRFKAICIWLLVFFCVFTIWTHTSVGKIEYEAYIANRPPQKENYYSPPLENNDNDGATFLERMRNRRSNY
jgi:energy-coupling factor transporter transmembrane protein EcfT